MTKLSQQAQRELSFVIAIVGLAFAFRLLIVIGFALTGAVDTYELSRDSARYHSEGVEIARQMAAGDFNWPKWIDNGWFQLTGFIYLLLGEHRVLIQLLNITLSSATVLVGYLLARRCYPTQPDVARLSAISLAFFPSLVFWSTMVLKDPLGILCVSTIALCAVALRQRFELRYLVLFFVAMLCLAMIRTYLCAVMGLLFMVALLPVGQTKSAMHAARLLSVILVFGVVTSFTPLGPFALDYIRTAAYFDLEYINHIRIKMGGHGSGTLYARGTEISQWGGDLQTSVEAFFRGVYFFFFAIDLTNLRSFRQLMALPEFLLVLVATPFIIVGVRHSWRHNRTGIWPLLVIGLGVMAVYLSATTNIGAMFRWRTQVMPFLLIIGCAAIVHALDKRRAARYQRRSVPVSTNHRSRHHDPLQPLSLPATAGGQIKPLT